MLHHAMDVQKHVKIYMLVFGALAFLTVVTVLVSYLKANIIIGILIALVIASIKGSLVACYFMHLISERKMIYTILVLTAVGFVALMGLTLASFQDQEGVAHVPAGAVTVSHGGH